MAPKHTLRLMLLCSALALSCPCAYAAQPTPGNPASPPAEKARAPFVTLSASNMRLAEILDKIREQTGFTLVVDEKHLDTRLTLKLSRVDVETAARRLARKLSLDNYALVMDAPGKTITLRAVGALAQQPKQSQPAAPPDQPQTDGQPQYLDDEALAKLPVPDTDPMDEEILPPGPGEERGMTRREFEAARAAANPPIDPMDEEILPPGPGEERGMTRREFEAAKAAANPEGDPMDEEVLPPSEEGGRGVTRREFEAARDASPAAGETEQHPETPPAANP
ncbi:MAG: hypothetical protein RDU30_11460 [Desulfovibrionaceae bacterium]|nr:hypothetical protein [Desulfovibrionaceae bacterium]